MSTLGDTKVHVGVIMNTLGVFSTPGGVQYIGGHHEYTGGFWYNEKRPLPNFQDFCSHTFCDYAVVYVVLWNIRQLVKISLSCSQSPDPNTFLVSYLIKSL